MKKLLTLILAVFISIAAHATPQTVQVVWPFSISSQQANLLRAMIENANQQQNKYQFIFISKPGAGGSIAANVVADATDLTILASSSSFYIRPQLYKDSHDIEKFNMVGSMCLAQPLAIFSKKLDKLSDKNGQITLGILPGSITALATRMLVNSNPGISILEVPYKGTPEATSDMLGGHIDGSVDFIGTSVTARFGPDIKVLGMTGNRSMNGYKTFQSLGVKGVDKLVVDFYLFANKKVDPSTREELNLIFKNTYKDPKVIFACEDDFGQVVYIPFNRVDKVNEEQKAKWKAFTATFTKE